MKTSKKPDIPYIMSVLADLVSQQYGIEITIKCTPKEVSNSPALKEQDQVDNEV